MDLKQSWLCKTPIAHRGLHNEEIPENSLSAYENAIKYGYAIELDVRLIDDGTVIVFHDDKLARMTGEDRYASTLTLSDLDNIRLKNSDQKIPTFKQVLDFVDGRTPLLIEIKNEGKPGALEDKTIELLRSYKGEYAIQAFNPFVLEYFRHHAPQIKRGILSALFKKHQLPSFIKRYVLSRMLLNNIAKPDFITYRHECLPNKYVNKYVKKYNAPVIAWTTENQAETDKVLPHCDNYIFENFIPQEK
ncbi:MAG: glycerophosphodiester phosphodiesterase [Clostridiales bacterium]|nr:glycerophosphodiester phosphodiesterase [Clostridiales bacterium]